MEDKQILLDNINKVHTTEMGINRIIKNLKLNTNDVVEYCKNKVLDKNCRQCKIFCVNYDFSIIENGHISQ